jgi:PKD repeat protein
LQTGPGGDLFYVDIEGGAVRRIVHSVGNRPPVAALSATPTGGRAPLEVAFDARASSDPDGDALGFAWDLNGDGVFGDASGAAPRFRYESPGAITARVRVTDARGATATASTIIRVGSTPPRPVIDAPVMGNWKVNDLILFSGHADDDEDGRLAPAALRWTLVIQHCPSDCHEHILKEFVGVEVGSFVAIDHEYPMRLVLVLTATDSSGSTATATRLLDPATTTVVLNSVPPGLALAFNGEVGPAPVQKTVIVGSSNSVSAPTQVVGNKSFRFVGWSDGGGESHTVVAGAAASYTATFAESEVTPPAPVAENLAGRGRITAKVTSPRGSGNRSLEIIRDGQFGPVGSSSNALQYDTFTGSLTATQDWVGYEFARAYRFDKVVFQEGRHFWHGGWFSSLTVQVRRGGVWVNVGNLGSNPGYFNGRAPGYETFTLSFDPIEGDGIRLFGRPGGLFRFISIAELEAWGVPVMP